jgi:tRNA(Arg) A34 adenosine deaminase TadA
MGQAVLVQMVSKSAANLTEPRVLIGPAAQSTSQGLQAGLSVRSRDIPFVGQVIAGTGESIQGQDRWPHGTGHQPGAHGEVLVVLAAMKSLAVVCRGHAAILSTMSASRRVQGF